MALRSSHCRIPVGLASMDRPLLVSSVESQLWGFCSWLYRASWLARVHSPASPIALLLVFCSGVPSGSLLQVSRQVFAMGLPFRVESVSVLVRNEVSSSTFLVFGWSLRDGVTLSGRGCHRSRSERRLFCAPSLVVGV